jgi:hypothetical protein
MNHRYFILLFAGVALGLVGCSGSDTMPEKDKETLKSNLNTPVDVEKIRSEYAKQKGNQTGAPTEKM